MRTRALATLLTCTLPLASQILVSPPGYDAREGSSRNGYPFARTMRYQQFHPDLKGVAEFKTSDIDTYLSSAVSFMTQEDSP